MKRLSKARNHIARALTAVGILMLLFAVLWWVLAVNRLVRFPTGVELYGESDVTVERLAATHGLLRFDPPQKDETGLGGRLVSVDDRYTSGEAVLARVVSSTGNDLPGGIELDSENTYVISRSDCINRKSPLARSSGAPVDRSGSWTVNFPQGTGKKSYNLFNEDAASTLAVSFVKEDSVNGVKVYLFEGSFRHRPLVDYRARAMGLPASTTYGAIKAELGESGIPIDRMVSSASGSLTREETETISSFRDDLEVGLDYTVKYRWEAAVEPVTGTVVDVRSEQTRIFVNTDVQTFLPLFEVLANHAEDPVVVRYLSQLDQQKILEPKEIFRITGGYTAETAADLADHANGRIGPIRFVKGWMTYLFLALGAVFAIGGFVLKRERHLHLPHHHNGGEPQPAAEEPSSGQGLSSEGGGKPGADDEAHAGPLKRGDADAP